MPEGYPGHPQQPRSWQNKCPSNGIMITTAGMAWCIHALSVSQVDQIQHIIKKDHCKDDQQGSPCALWTKPPAFHRMMLGHEHVSHERQALIQQPQKEWLCPNSLFRIAGYSEVLSLARRWAFTSPRGRKEWYWTTKIYDSDSQSKMTMLSPLKYTSCSSKQF